MPRRQRPSLSSPSYGALTGSINWARGMDESLARPVSYAPPVSAPAPTPTPITTNPRGPYGGGCPSVDAWVIRRGWFGWRQKVRAGTVRVGDRLLLIDGRWGRVSYSTRFAQPCRQIETFQGSLCCSESAPLLLESGEVVQAVQLLKGQRLQTMRGRSTVLANLVRGLRDIQLITCENAFYWCRSEGDAWFAHHNMKKLSGTSFDE